MIIVSADQLNQLLQSNLPPVVIDMNDITCDDLAGDPLHDVLIVTE